ncbi:N-acetylmuramoyl-L-alanine amidase [Dysgonomonas sp. PFB1-18]|uniref:N-acetylmuramoyl-L-alanine amidase n=1 Tax=unclassified Dysgonomonas TaxID=2630389 RepID=UPI0024756AEB|nr:MULTISPECIES: N-acetylmuramoyl-L-alanine amidase [unclassified Dysgonomonas]MDH6308055.1 N-acetylmuramoyl-L-alanine amidase [Dysgonomonas sp. PF1-14]MDH6339594.1 N-acetylmuramoyl-L-alanine amidase [Dysgonomonas sp. PF1-16]MDH6381245.1 N-acetylmuramoyl-L-alanine amidase [Dysgonomonas sp. PFB1-18]MDH6398457.1 N-acetylmuramoyl-L-alanine amidase [Dysgonomonas sp. PF1-23]
MKVLIDNGHGVNTPGKRSPDGSLREYLYAREIADRVVSELKNSGIDAERIVKEDVDISISERCKRANAIYKATGKKAILISVHCNAAGNGSSWMNARGWSVHVSTNASKKSKELATCFANIAMSMGLKVRKPLPNQPYWVQNLGICRDTNCPAILVENFFMDNKQDCEFLLSPEGRDQIVDLHVNAILKYIKGV